MPFSSKTVYVRGNVIDPNLVALQSSPPIEPITHGSTFIVTTAGEWGEDCYAINVVPGDVVQWNNLTNRFKRVTTLHKGQRFIVGGATDVYEHTLISVVSRVVKYNGGPIDDVASYVVVDGNPPRHATSIKVVGYHSMFNNVEFRYDSNENLWKYQRQYNEFQGPGYDSRHVVCRSGADVLSELDDVEIDNPVDGNMLVYLDGKFVNKSLDDLFLPTIEMAAGNSIAAGDFIYVSGDSTGTPGISNDEHKFNVVGAAANKCIIGETVYVRDSGELNAYTDLVPGDKYYLSSTKPGKITNVPPTVEGQYIIQVGVATSTTELLIDIKPSILL